ncbi:MAG: hypothetical protein AAB304_03120 [Pseudomonadota bacterium]
MMASADTVRTCINPRCMGNYDFEHIAHYARKRFVEGFDTVALLQQASSQREKEEIALVCLLDVKEDVIRDLQLSCQHADKCEVTDCRDRLRDLIERDLADKNIQ